MTPAELNKQLTLLLNGLLADTGFAKKRIGRLSRRTKECEQFLSFSFTRRRGFPGNLYDLAITLSFSFKDADMLTSKFLGQEYDAAWGTGAKSFYTVIPDSPLCKFQYCADKPLRQFTEMIAADFHSYALPFYEKYDSLDKLEACFDRHPHWHNDKDAFHVVRSGRQGSGRGCCIAAVLCLQKKWDKLQILLDNTDLLFSEQKERIAEYVSNR